MGLWSWTKTAASRVGGAVATAGKAVGGAVSDFAQDPVGTTQRGIAAVERGRQWAVEKTAIGLNYAGQGITYAWENKGKILPAVGGFAKYSITNPHKAAAMFYQGCFKGATSMVGMAVDAGRGLARHTYNLGIENKADMWTNEPGLNGEPYRGFSDRWRQGVGDWTNRVIVDKIMGGSERSTYDKIWGYTGEAAFEAATFVGVSAVTGGAGGAAIASARLGAYGARAVAAGTKVARGVAALGKVKGFRTAFSLASRFSTKTNLLTSTAKGFKATGRIMSPILKKAHRAEELREKAEKMRRAAFRIGTREPTMLNRMFGRTLSKTFGRNNMLAKRAARLEAKAHYLEAGNRAEALTRRAEYVRKHGRFFSEARANRLTSRAAGLGDKAGLKPFGYTTTAFESVAEGGGAVAHVGFTWKTDSDRAAQKALLDQTDDENSAQEDAIDSFIDESEPLSIQNGAPPLTGTFSQHNGTATTNGSHNLTYTFAESSLETNSPYTVMSPYTGTTTPSELGTNFASSGQPFRVGQAPTDFQLPSMKVPLNWET